MEPAADATGTSEGTFKTTVPHRCTHTNTLGLEASYSLACGVIDRRREERG